MPHSSCSKETPPEAQGIYLLSGLEISFVSGCPKGANPGAKVLLKKEYDMKKQFAKDGGDNNSTTPQVNVNFDTEAFSKTLADTLQGVLNPLLKKEGGADPAIVVDAAVAAVSTEVGNITKDLTKSLQDEIEKAKVEIAKSAEAAKDAKLNKDADPVLVIDGKSFAKSAVGDAAFEALSLVHGKNEAMRKEMEHKSLVGRVEKEYPNVAGEPDHKAAVLKAIEGLPEKDKECGLAMLKALNDMGEEFSKEVGHTGQKDQASASIGKLHTDGDATMKLEKMAEEYAKVHKISKAQAYVAILDTEEGSALYDQHRANA